MFAVLHIADFALCAVLRMEGESASRVPSALLEETGRKVLVVSCNSAAREHGVSAGQTAAQALAHCSGLHLHTRQPAAEREAHAALLAAALLLSPKVEHTAEGLCTIDVRGLDVIRQKRFLSAAVKHLRALDLPVTGGLASTPLLALYAARSVTDDERRQALNLDCTVKSQDLTSFGGIRIVADNHAFLAPLPLTVADPEPGLLEVLEGWGIRTLGALTALRKEEVAHRLGPAGLELWERAAGESTRVLKLVSPPVKFVASMEFEHEVETLEPLLFILRRFVDRLAMELEAACMAAVELSLRLKMSDDTQHVRSFRLPEPTVRADILFRTLHTHLEQVRTGAAITAVFLRVKPARPPVRQRGLFETELNDPHGFAETLARVVAIVGSGRVGTPYVQDTHRPDAAVMETPAEVVPPFAPSPVLPLLGLPLRRFRPPRAARVEMESGVPVSVWSDGVRGVIAVVRGPWRGRGDWWEVERVWKREEWDAELSGGGIYRLVRTPDGWFVEGEYD